MQKEMAEMEFLLKQKETLEASMKQQEIQSGFVQSMFFTFQFGGGSMLSAGAGLSFFSNVVRPEVLAGYSPSGEYKSLSFAAKLNARILGIKITESSGFFATIGANFTFFSGNAKIAPSAFLAQEFDFKDVLFMSTFTFYFEENFYFIENKEGSVLFQLGIGIRMSIF
ncbi:MAG TPA: hypothetical protein DHW82_06325 [Spirochaetia bacterium]|nr:hypothetical protein [Spirochaetia bacterium]